ncbi:MAG TPA: response regulator [Syntrophomonadaceae bacterium]|nr:response regulator [Syntrophomonadaceae bacterium]
MHSRKSKPLIFIIEDNEFHLRLARDLLVAHGMQVLHTSNPQEAVTQIENSRPDLILIDISLKEANGLDIARKIKGNPLLSHIPIVALSAYATKKDEENARAAGCDDFIVKPVNTRLFPRQIADNLGHQDN